ncbi:hypothetical protein HUB98_04315 [Paenibacillus barcinonensis]|uniref:Uncharacterized protein n=1 Tax=Paenibacillus barcinonensis TaxID=198119 RepID=A0A2V4V353_PAEBA|nr:hypothetical protein [Paenibacillus barcinonensis]PYE43246.1 hypothetical protein DFQ00_1296 [Paenibacillus barcinonensis]QKS55619.1 hypothetical protein HUB98_04315 [Paenibacillus barcinonensis]
MYFFMLFLVGVVLCFLFPYGPIIVGGIVFAVVIDHYRQTAYMREDIQAIKNHLKLMNKAEQEEYEMEQAYQSVDRIPSERMEVINRKIEMELERERKNKET